MAKKKEGTQYKCTPRYIHTMMLILGILILLNAKYAWFSWAVFIGGIIAIKGLIGLLMPNCVCHK